MMQDKKLEELVNDVVNKQVIFDNCDPSVSLVAILELRAAEERLNLYFKEKKNLSPTTINRF